MDVGMEDEMSEFPRARIDHTCTVCGEIIHKGSTYVRRKLKSLDYVEKYHWNCKPKMKHNNEAWEIKFSRLRKGANE